MGFLNIYYWVCKGERPKFVGRYLKQTTHVSNLSEQNVMQVEIPSPYDHGSRRQRRIRRTEETQKQKKMVAISMYRGNLHKVPDVPRRWIMPDRNLSFKDFKSLLHRRKKALSRLPLNPNLNLSVKTELVTDQENPILPSEANGSSGKQKLFEVKREEICGNRVKGDENNDRGFEGARSDGGDRPGRVTESKETDNVPHKYAAKEEEVCLNFFDINLYVTFPIEFEYYLAELSLESPCSLSFVKYIGRLGKIMSF